MAMSELDDIPAVPAGKVGWPWQSCAERESKASDERNPWPRITIVTPSFNQGTFLEQTLRSVLLQGYPNLEYLVLDGGSSDDSVGILNRYGRHLAYWHSRSDAGQADAIATGFERATGEIYGYVNSDDILLPGALKHVARKFMRFRKTGVVYGNRLVVDEDGKVIGRHFWPYFLSRYHWACGQPLAQESCFWRKDAYWDVGGIDRSKFFVLDYDLFYRMWMKTRFLKTRAFLGCIRVHGDTKRARHDDIRLQEMALARSRYALREPGYFRVRVMNLLDRAQVSFDTLAERVFGSNAPCTDARGERE
jgi:glycosyltransferase involved in cell wall biosynthesis